MVARRPDLEGRGERMRQCYASLLEQGFAHEDAGEIAGMIVRRFDQRLAAGSPGERLVSLYLIDGDQAAACVDILISKMRDGAERHQVVNARTAAAYHGRGLIGSLYLHLAARGVMLYSDFEQTSDAVRLWKRLVTEAPERGLEVRAHHVCKGDAGPVMPDMTISDGDEIYGPASMYLMTLGKKKQPGDGVQDG